MYDKNTFSLKVIVFALLGAAPLSHGQSIKGFLPFSQAIDNITIPYRLFIPAGYNASNKYPLMVYLHGVGSRGNDNAAQLNSGFTDKFSGAAMQTKYPCFILSPQCPKTNRWSDDSISKIVMGIINSVELKYPLDTNRIYLTGWSMGGKGTFSFLANYPGVFAAAVPMSGSGDPSKIENIRKTPLWISHGTQDPTAGISGSCQIVYALTNHGESVWWEKTTVADLNETMMSNSAKIGSAKFVFTEITDGKHVEGQSSAAKNPLLPAWLFSKKLEKY